LGCASSEEESLRSALDLERQRTALLEQSARQEVEAANARAAALDRELSQVRSGIQAELFSENDLAEYRSALTSGFRTVGASLLAETHPTGRVLGVSSPIVSRSQDYRTIGAQYTVRWMSLFDNEYVTIYRVVFAKGRVDRVEVVRDGALVAIEPSFLRDAQARLQRELFR
jgi:hypothetical protein